MTLRSSIESIFQGQAFLRPLFYRYPGGLCFRLSEGGNAITQFLTAHRKATEICADIFSPQDHLVVCLQVYAILGSKFAYRSTLAALSNAGIDIPRQRELWLSTENDSDSQTLHLAFPTSLDLLPSLLWCALATDFGVIEPRPTCTVYLFNLAKGLVTLPYDDRGMDVVGTNTAHLATLYHRHSTYLLEYDLPSMQNTFRPHREH